MCYNAVYYFSTNIVLKCGIAWCESEKKNSREENTHASTL